MAFKTLPLPLIGMTALGILSGILSSYELGFLGDIEILGIHIQQGLLFGLVIAFGLYRWGQSGWPGALLAMLMVIAAWIAAVNSFTFLSDAGLGTYPSGMVAGAIGAFGTIMAGALTVSALRRPAAWLSTISVGAVLGLLVIFATRSSDDYLLILFVPWQGLVAACIGYALAHDSPAFDTSP